MGVYDGFTFLPLGPPWGAPPAPLGTPRAAAGARVRDLEPILDYLGSEHLEGARSFEALLETLLIFTYVTKPWQKGNQHLWASSIVVVAVNVMNAWCPSPCPN